MSLDPSIPLKGLLINRNDENQKQQQLQMNQLRVQEYQQGQENKKRLADLIPQAVQGNQAALGQIGAIDPDVWSKITTHQHDALKRNQDKILMGAKIIRQINPQDEAGWQMARQAAQQVGLDLSDVPPNYDPNYVRSLTSIADAMEKDVAPTGMERNYEFLRQKNPQLAEQYLQGQANPMQWVRTETDEGTSLTAVPRAGPMAGGGQPDLPVVSSPEEAKRLPPGTAFRTPDGRTLRVPGGQQGSAPAGRFPDIGPYRRF